MPRGECFRAAVALLRESRLNRRAARRLPVKWSAHVWLIGAAPDVFPAEVVEVSPAGFSLLAAKPVAVGERVAVETAGCLAFGDVLHCGAEAGGFRIGMRIIELSGDPAG